MCRNISFIRVGLIELLCIVWLVVSRFLKVLVVRWV